MDIYKTLKKDASCEYVIQKSRFICHASPVNNEEEAIEYVNNKKSEYKDANHNCYGYIIGENKNIIRYSDDGEPSGTAGLPIIEVIKTLDVVNCVVVITRYFGGKLLGAGGLVRAYSHSCTLAINEAIICEMISSTKLQVQADYSHCDRLNYLFENSKVVVEETQYQENVIYLIISRDVDLQQIIEDINIKTNRTAKITNICNLNIQWEVD